MNKLHIVMIPFTGVGLYGGYRGDEWFRERVRVFKKFTLQSLLNQTEKGFLLWLTFRPEEEHNPILKELQFYLDGCPVDYVMTFNGLMYWDDKFPTSPIEKVKVLVRHLRWVLRKRRWETLWPMFREVWWSKNATLEKRLANSLPTILDRYQWWKDKPWDEIPNGTSFYPDWVYLSRIDSDDMFRRDALGKFLACTPEHARVVQCWDGYIYNEDTDELATWEPLTNPPFHTLIFSAQSFFKASQHLATYRGYRSHEDIDGRFDGVAFGDELYCVTVHGTTNHISTTWNHPFRGPLITSGKEAILESFGL